MAPLTKRLKGGFMKKLFFLLFLVAGIIQAQSFANPISTTKHYHFRQYAQDVRVPATVLNGDKAAQDSIIYSLIVYVDTSQFVMKTDTTVSDSGLVLKISNYACGSSAFTTTATVDSSVTLAKTLSESNDIFLLTPYGTSITSNDVLCYSVNGHKLIVRRPSSGTSGLKYKWRWIRRY